MKCRAFSLVELLISTTIILILLLAVGAAIIQTLRVQAFHAGRASMGRTAAELTARLGEEARSSTAVFIPSFDVLGNPNTGAAGSHEVDFFRRRSQGGDAFVAYRFDSGSGEITRYEYTSASGVPKIANADLAASDIASFSAVRLPVADAGTTAGASDPAQVSILYGRRELVGGNDVIVASVQAKTSGGVPGREFSVHLASRAAPTALAILAPIGSPSAPPVPTVIPFVVLRPGYPILPPHGPVHGGSSGAGDPSIHWVAAAGTAEFFGPGTGGAGDWFEFTAAFARVDSGVFSFKAADGSSITAVIGCSDGPCPAFRPLPVSAPGFTPKGGVAFQLAP